LTEKRGDTLQQEVRIFRTVECGQQGTDVALGERLKRHADDRSILNQSSPQIPWFAYVLAKRGIRNGEADYEIDRSLE
jgi:hypothetical protein